MKGPTLPKAGWTVLSIPRARTASVNGPTEYIHIEDLINSLEEYGTQIGERDSSPEKYVIQARMICAITAMLHRYLTNEVSEILEGCDGQVNQDPMVNPT